MFGTSWFCIWKTPKDIFWERFVSFEKNQGSKSQMCLQWLQESGSTPKVAHFPNESNIAKAALLNVHLSETRKLCPTCKYKYQSKDTCSKSESRIMQPMVRTKVYVLIVMLMDAVLCSALAHRWHNRPLRLLYLLCFLIMWLQRNFPTLLHPLFSSLLCLLLLFSLRLISLHVNQLPTSYLPTDPK